MRIAIISEVFLPKIDGVVNRTLNLIRRLRRHGDELLIVCPQAPGTSGTIHVALAGCALHGVNAIRNSFAIECDVFDLNVCKDAQSIQV